MELAGSDDRSFAFAEPLGTEREQKVQSSGTLKDRLRFEQLVSDLSAHFVNISPEK